MPTTSMSAAASETAPALPPGLPHLAGREGRFQSGARAFYAAMGWLLAAAATVLASTGQIEYAHVAGITDLRRFLVPAILEIAVIFVLLGGYLRACDGDSPALMWALAATITAFATWTNLAHGGERAGRIFAAATVLTFVLWILKLRDRYRVARRVAGLLDSPTAKFRLIRWLVMPRRTVRAWLIAVEYGLRDADTALARARLWRDIYLDTSDTLRDERRLARRRAARRAAALAIRATHTPVPKQGGENTDTVAHPTAVAPQLRPDHYTTPAAASERGPEPVERAADHDVPIDLTSDDPSAAGPSLPVGTTSAPRDRETAATSPHHKPEPRPARESGGSGDNTAAVIAATPTQPDTAVSPAHDGPAETGDVYAAADLPNLVEPAIYTPTSDEDAQMYTAWCDAVGAGQEPSGVDLARAAGRRDDATGVGRRAARRYRQAHGRRPLTLVSTHDSAVTTGAAVDR